MLKQAISQPTLIGSLALTPMQALEEVHHSKVMMRDE
jgi:hypothetical protein